MNNSNTEQLTQYQRYTKSLKNSLDIVDKQILELQLISGNEQIKTPSLSRRINKLTKELTDFRTYLYLRITTAELKHCLIERKPSNKKTRRIA